MKKVALFVHCYPPAQGGLEYLSSEIVRVLSKKADVNVFTGKGRTLDSYKNFNNWIDDDSDETRVHRLPLQKWKQRFANKFLYNFVVKFGILSPWYFGPLLNFSRQDKEIISKSDLILGIGMPTSSLMYAHKYSHKFKTPLIILPAYHPIAYYNRVFVFQKALHKANKVLYLSKYEKENLLKTYLVDKDKLQAINFSPFSKTDLLEVGDLVKTRLKKIKSGPLTIGFVGQITARKNLRMIAEISKSLSSRGFPNRILLAGLRTNTSDVVEELFSKNENVKFEYNFNDKKKRKIYSQIDLFINPSLEESLGITTLEAMRYGCLTMTRFPLVESSISPLVFQSKAQAIKQILSLNAKRWEKQLESQAKFVTDLSKENFEKQILAIME